MPKFHISRNGKILCLPFIILQIYANKEQSFPLDFLYYAIPVFSQHVFFSFSRYFIFNWCIERLQDEIPLPINGMAFSPPKVERNDIPLLRGNIIPSHFKRWECPIYIKKVLFTFLDIDRIYIKPSQIFHFVCLHVWKYKLYTYLNLRYYNPTMNLLLIIILCQQKFRNLHFWWIFKYAKK